MVLTTRGISSMKLEEVDAKLQDMGWQPASGVKLTLLEKKSILCELLEKSKEDDSGSQDDLKNFARKSKEELKKICSKLQIPLTGNETKPQLQRPLLQVVWRKSSTRGTR